MKYFNFDWTIESLPIIEQKENKSNLKERLRGAYESLFEKQQQVRQQINGETETDHYQSITDLQNQASYREGISLFY